MSAVAGYEGLTETQQAEFSRLWNMSMSDWPEGLQAAVAGEQFRCGETYAEAIGQWVKQEIPAKEKS